MKYYDERKELGSAGLLSMPESFTRDTVYYDYSWFFNATKAEMAAIDLYYAEDVTPSYNENKFRQVPGYVATLNEPEERYDIVLNTEAIPAEEATASKQSSMQSEGDKLTQADDNRVSVGASNIIPDRPAHDLWMKAVYDDIDGGVVNTHKPPPDERQHLAIIYEDADPFIFTRYQDQWGWRWHMLLTRADVSNLALYIQNSSGGYLYTTGALIDNGDGTYYTECPAGQADATPEDVYFHWILGAGRISSDFKYAGDTDTLEGVVRSDEEYD